MGSFWNFVYPLQASNVPLEVRIFNVENRCITFVDNELDETEW
jgi:hypothetical protein